MQLLVEQSIWCMVFPPSLIGMQREDARGILSKVPHVERCVLWLLLQGNVSLSVPSETGNTFSLLRHMSHNLCTSNFFKCGVFFFPFTTYAYLFPFSKRNSNLM